VVISNHWVEKDVKALKMIQASRGDNSNMKRTQRCIFVIAVTILMAAAIYTMTSNKDSQENDSILYQLSYGMTIDDVTQIVGDLGPNLGSGRSIFDIKLPDKRGVKFVFDGILSEVYIQEIGREWIEKWGKDWLEYDLNKQEILFPFMPNSLVGIQYGMTEEEIEKVFCSDHQQNVLFYGSNSNKSTASPRITLGEFLSLERSRPISLSSYSYPPQYAEHVCLIRLSTGEWVNMGFEIVEMSFDPTIGYHRREYRLLYVYMKADDGEWYVYDLNTQKLTEERVPKERVWEGHE